MNSTSERASIEVGLVSADRRTVDFYATVFGLTELPAVHFEIGTLHRLRAADAMVKVLIPIDVPAAREPPPTMSERGLSYLTIRVGDFDDVLARVSESFGAIVAPAQALGSDRRLAMVRDPDGTLIEVIEVTAVE